MGPKKPPKKEEKAAVEEQDNSIPINEVNFKLTLDTKHEGGHYLKVKFDWFQIGAAPSDPAKPHDIEKMEIDSGFMKDWTLIQIEGEEPVPQTPPEEEKGGKGGKKAPPPKGGDKKAAGTLEEITDNRPREMQFVKNFGEDAGAPTKILEEVARFFETFYLHLSVWKTDRETQEESLAETYDIDMSHLLFNNQKDGSTTWTFDKMQTMEIHYLKVTLGWDQPLLNNFLRRKLNPLQVELVACKKIPFKTEPQYKPIFAIFKFVDGREFRTMDLPQQAACRFKHKHVFLIGHLDPVMLKEELATRIVQVELHDCDEYIEDEEDAKKAKFSAGRAKFTFRDFLRPNCLELRLCSDVFPLKRDEVDNTQNLDLNTTARKNEKTVEKASPYLINNTYSTVVANLARPIGHFDEDYEKQLFLKQLQAEKEAQQSAGEEQPPGSPNVSKTAKTPAIESGGESKHDGQSIQDKISLRGTLTEWNENDAIFERMIIMIPYKSPDMVKRIEGSFEKCNLKGLDLPNVRYLSTKEFNEEERKNRKLDFIGGFCLMDSETRMYILEGLGGEGRMMYQFYQDNMRDRPNDRKYTLLYNPQIRFKNRIYLDFNATIKKIKLREPLRQTMGSPDIYLRSKVPEEMFYILQQFAEIRKLTRLQLIRDFNLFPETDKLLTLERKYGDSLNYEDLHGVAKPKKKKVAPDGTVTGESPEKQTEADLNKTADGSMMMSTQQANITMENSKYPRKDDKRKADTDANNYEFDRMLTLREKQGPDNFKLKNVQRVHSMNSGRPLKQRLVIPEGMQVFQYGNQRYNIWETQKEELREIISKDPSKFYTYSAEHLSLAFPIVNENEIAQKEKEENERRWKTKAGFDNVMKRENWNEHPKRPDEFTMHQLQIPYHEQRAETKQRLKGFQYVPADYGKPDFQSKIKVVRDTFSHPDYFKTVFISGDDMVKELAEQKQKEIDDFNKKVVVDNQHFYVNTLEKQKAAQLDKYRNIREDAVKKVGLRHPRRRISAMVERQIHATRFIEDPPVAMLKEEDYQLKGYRPPFKPFDPGMSMSAKNMDTNVSVQHRQQSPVSRKVFIQPVSASEKVGPKWGQAA